MVHHIRTLLWAGTLEQRYFAQLAAPLNVLGPGRFCCTTAALTHKHSLNKWPGSPPSGQTSRCRPVHLINHGSPLCSAPLDPVQHLFSHQGMLCWRGVATPLYRLALPSWGSGEDEVRFLATKRKL